MRQEGCQRNPPAPSSLMNWLELLNAGSCLSVLCVCMSIYMECVWLPAWMTTCMPDSVCAPDAYSDCVTVHLCQQLLLQKMPA